MLFEVLQSWDRNRQSLIILTKSTQIYLPMYPLTIAYLAMYPSYPVFLTWQCIRPLLFTWPCIYLPCVTYLLFGNVHMYVSTQYYLLTWRCMHPVLLSWQYICPPIIYLAMYLPCITYSLGKVCVYPVLRTYWAMSVSTLIYGTWQCTYVSTLYCFLLGNVSTLC